MQDSGRLVSGEFAQPVPLLQKAFDRCGITCAVAVENNAAVHNNTWPKFDRVLCDVPCSGLGVIAKKPDIRYKDLDGIENLLDTQQKNLAKRGGFPCRKRPFGVFYLYSKCSGKSKSGGKIPFCQS